MDNIDKHYPSEKLMAAYFSGNLSAEKRALLEQRMATDPGVAERVALYRKEEQTLRFARKEQLKNQFLTHFDSRERTETPERTNDGRPNFLYWATAVALVMLCSTVAFFMGKNVGRQQSPAPIIIRDTFFMETPPKNLDTVPNSNQNSQRASPLIAALHLRPEAGDTRGIDNRLPADTLRLIDSLWRAEKHSDVVRLARPYLRTHHFKADIWTLYADSEFKLGNYRYAESAYRELATFIAVEQEAKWNLLLCYALQWPKKKREFESLAREVDGWEQPNIFQKKLDKLRTLMSNQ